jgi:hypothetical protein
MKMNRPNIKKAFAALTVISLALAASLTYGLMSGRPASAKSAYSPSNLSAAPAAISSAATVAAQTTGVVMPRTAVYALGTNNTLYVLVPGTTSFVRLVHLDEPQVNGNLIGIDFRVADGNNNSIYALTDNGKIYTIGLTAATLGQATLVSTLTPNLPSGYQSLFDFNPVLNAIRAIGSDGLNYAVVNSAGNLNKTVVQTSLTYNPNDVNKGKTPKVSAGAYNNNVVGAKVTIFYGIDYNLATFVTVDPATPGGSSATGGGVLRTIGNLVTPTGGPVSISPTADIDIYTLSSGANRLVGIDGRTFFTIDLAQATPATALGTSKNVVVQGIPMAEPTGGERIDIAAAPTSYEAENATRDAQSTVDTNFPGFSGTGFVNFADNVAGAFVEFQVNQSGAQTLIFRYANGSTVNRPCNVTVDGTSVGTVTFPPTGAWSTYKTTTLSVSLPISSAFKAVRVTNTTTNGGPNLDKMNVE